MTPTPKRDEVEAVALAMRSQHHVRWPRKPTKEEPNPIQEWSVTDCAAPFAVVRGPFKTEVEANDALIELRCELAIAALDESRARDKGDGWQDIFTAPKDGMKILVGEFNERDQQWELWCDYWRAYLDGLGAGFGRGNPTVWSYMPAPPAEPSEGET